MDFYNYRRNVICVMAGYADEYVWANPAIVENTGNVVYNDPYTFADNVDRQNSNGGFCHVAIGYV